MSIKNLFHLLVICLVAVSASARTLAATPEKMTSGVICTGLKCEYFADPRGIQEEHPRLSWQLQSTKRGVVQTAYRILVASSAEDLAANEHITWDSGEVQSPDSVGVTYDGPSLSSAQTCYWEVKVWDGNSEATSYSQPALWQMGLLRPSDWKAQWIGANTPRDTKVDGDTLPPVPYFRKTFTVDKAITRATIFVTARGAYELHLNGRTVSDDKLAPGWTDFDKRIDYQTFDVTSSLHRGENAVGAILGDGWYSAYIGFARQRNLYGSQPLLLLQMEIEYADGTHTTVVTDNSWKASLGPILYSDLLQGEMFDSRMKLVGWDTSGYSASTWQPVSTSLLQHDPEQRDVTSQIRAMVNANSLDVTASNDIAGDPAYNTVKQLTVDYSIDGAVHKQTVPEKGELRIPGQGEPNGKLVILHAVYGAPDRTYDNPELLGAQGPPIVVTQHLAVQKITQPTPGAYILDMGQNMVGWARLTISQPAGTRVQLRFGEVLNPNGTLYTANLRSARATDTYICDGKGQEVWEPKFTFHGFRYVEMTGIAHPTTDMLTGCVVGSDITPMGSFTCSNELVNKIQHNIVWGQRGNFISVPTDCPQRDERLGWMGDAQIFSRTATYNRDVSTFYEKWIKDVEDGQSAEGGYSDVSPRLVDLSDGAPAWGDAGVIVPYNVWQAYGDVALLKNHWASMERWMDYITSVNPNGLWLQRRNNDFGDWLSINADTPKEVLATAYYAHDAQLMEQMARAIGDSAAEAKYGALFEHIKSAFDTAYVSADGTVHGETQTCYVLALHFNLLPDNLRPAAAQRLADAIHAANDHLSTGFVGVGYLCPTLTDNGLNDIAYKLLLNDTFPSWGFSVRQGATTIWERWDGYTPDKGFQDPGMNSFNHYSLGSVGEWLYRYVAGIDTDPDQPGFAHILMHPHPGPGLSEASATFDSIHGTISSDWSTVGGKFSWKITVPANTHATVWVPTDDSQAVTEGGQPVSTSQSVTSIRNEAGYSVYDVGSGSYSFDAPLTGH